MNELIFLTNELQCPEVQHDLKLPLIFINFGITKGLMFKYLRNKSNFVIPVDSIRRWGNEVVYGGIFLCKDFDYYSRILDAYHICSMSTIHQNHPLDIFHRITTDITPIYFSTLNDLSHLKYTEGNSVKAHTYFANINHPKIISRINSTYSYRITDGIDATNFTKLFREVNNAL